MNKDITAILVGEKELDALVTKVAGEIDADFQKTGGRVTGIDLGGRLREVGIEPLDTVFVDVCSRRGSLCAKA